MNHSDHSDHRYLKCFLAAQVSSDLQGCWQFGIQLLEDAATMGINVIEVVMSWVMVRFDYGNIMGISWEYQGILHTLRHGNISISKKNVWEYIINGNIIHTGTLGM